MKINQLEPFEQALKNIKRGRDMKKSDAIKDLLSIKERMDRLFEDVMHEAADERSSASVSWSPRVDVYETEEHYVLNAEVPGVSQENLDIQIKGNLLTIAGYRPLYADISSDDGTFHRIECSYGRFKRSFSIPDTVEQEKIKAHLKDGVLQIRIPKKKTVVSKQIRID
ncbi:MAG: Hsp20/alpha crystallin family protein [Nitrospirae bacterium]|nr:MAG: Hsp20/alpha crystallin family protein [Nitrospirota bacterium]